RPGMADAANGDIERLNRGWPEIPRLTPSGASRGRWPVAARDACENSAPPSDHTVLLLSLRFARPAVGHLERPRCGGRKRERAPRDSGQSCPDALRRSSVFSDV